MPSLTYSAIGTPAAYRFDITKVKPGFLMVSNDKDPTAKQASEEANLPLGQQIRASLLDTMGVTEEELGKMKKESRADLETNLAREVHAQVMARGAGKAGSFVSIKA